MESVGEPDLLAEDEDLFDRARRSVVAELAEAATEEQLADILHSICLAAESDLGMIDIPHDPVVQAHAVVATATAWASLASYATFHFYLGDEQQAARSNEPGGWSKRVASTLLNLTEILVQHLSPVRPALGARSLSVSESFPAGLSVELAW